MQVSPPRLYTGVAFMFWGAMTGNATIGLICAVLVEARHWVSLRFEFDDDAYVKAWQLSFILFILSIVIAWINGSVFRSLINVMVWLPVCFLPIELAQRYGRRDKMPISTFSYIARIHQKRDLQKGKHVRFSTINISYPFALLIILAAGFNAKATLYHFLGMCLLVFVGLWSLTKARKRNAWLFFLMSFLVLIPTYFGQIGLEKVSKFLYHQRGLEDRHNISASAIATSIGQIGELNQSSKIFWRVRGDNLQDYKLLRGSTYNSYFEDGTAKWKCRLVGANKSPLNDFDSLARGSVDDPYFYFKIPEVRNFHKYRSMPTVSVRGAVSTQDTLPIVGYPEVLGALSQRLTGNKKMKILGPEVEFNSFGSVRITNPDFAAIEYDIVLGNENLTESAPSEYDYAVPALEKRSVDEFVSSYQLKNVDQKEVLKRLRTIFTKDFKYTLNLKNSNALGQGSLHSFLLGSREGHCEYFATSSILILRKLGFAARYSVGYALREYDKSNKEYVVRGTHAHAWCRVFIDGTWVDFDPTPPSLIAENHTKLSLQERLRDLIQKFREDIAVWRVRDGNAEKLTAGIVALGALVIGFVLFRLRKHLMREARNKKMAVSEKLFLDPVLVPIIKNLEKILSKRHPNMPFVTWIQGLREVDANLTPLVGQVQTIYNRYRFDPSEANDGLREELQLVFVELKAKVEERLASSKIGNKKTTL